MKKILNKIPVILRRIWYYPVIICLISFPLFHKLGSKPIRLWDESRLAVNAWEMYHNHNYIVTYFGDKPDMWNTKPPLMIWAQVLSMKLFGINEFAVRFPSALAALLTCIMLLIVLGKYLGRLTLPLITIFTLVSSAGYVGHHVTRTGDYDSLLILFTTLYCLYFYLYLESKKIKHLYLAFLFIAFAVLTKSVAGLLFLPGLFIYALIKKQVLPLILNKHLYFGALATIGVIASYYLLRESQNPGYIEAVYNNELGGRYLATAEEHSHGILYYYYALFMQLSPWIFLAPAGLLIGYFYTGSKFRNISLFLIILIAIYFIIISKAQTKLPWYDAPLMPFLSIASAILLYFVYDAVLNSDLIATRKRKNLLAAVIIILILIFPFKKITDGFINDDEGRENGKYYIMSDYLKKAIDAPDTTLDNAIIVSDAQSVAYLKFYMDKLSVKGINTMLYNYPDLQAGQVAATGQESIQKAIESRYTSELIKDGTVKIYKILSERDTSASGVPEIIEEYDNIRVYNLPEKLNAVQ